VLKGEGNDGIFSLGAPPWLLLPQPSIIPFCHIAGVLAARSHIGVAAVVSVWLSVVFDAAAGATEARHHVLPTTADNLTEQGKGRAVADSVLSKGMIARGIKNGLVMYQQ